MAREIRWEINELPEAGDVIHAETPERGREALSDIEPLVELLGLYAQRHPDVMEQGPANGDTASRSRLNRQRGRAFGCSS